LAIAAVAEEPGLSDVSAAATTIALARRRGGKLLFMGSMVAQASALLRYIVLARLLGPEQLGLAATIVVTGSFFDLISETGSDRFLIQDRDGDTEPVQRLVQLVYVLRGLMIALALVVFAIPIAAFYGAPRLAVGLAGLALSPLILGFLHLDIRRQQRVQDFRAEAISLIFAESASLAATVIAAWITRDFTAILYGLVTRAVVMVLVSHLRAERGYRLGYSREHAGRLGRFAAPLMLTGLMLFVGTQGDRVVVANLLGFKALGHYSAVLLLIYYPTAMILRYVHSISVPMVAAVRDDPDARNRVGDLLGGQTLLLAIAMCAGFAVVAPIMIPILYGARYAQASLIVGMIGILQTARFMVVWPTTIALSLGHTRTVMLSSLVRILAYPAAFAGLWLVGGLSGVVGGFLSGEMIAISVAVVLVNRDTGRTLLQGFGRLATYGLVCAAVVSWNLIGQIQSPVFILGPVGLSVLAVGRIFACEATTLRTALASVRSVWSGVLRRRSPLKARAKIEVSE